jgi:hypothetical protein
MPNVLPFGKPDDGCKDARFDRQSSASPAVAGMPARISQTERYANAKEDVRHIIRMFDLALLQGRLAILKMDSQEARPRLETHLRVIEEMLDVARVMAAKL